jgi:hypothetical protein
MNDLIQLRDIVNINNSAKHVEEDIREGCENCPLLAKVLIERVHQAEADVLRALGILAGKYEHAHQLNLDAITAPGIAVQQLMSTAGIQVEA